MSNNDKRVYLQFAQEVRDEVAQIRASVNQLQEQRWAQLAGEHLQAMMESKNATIAYLDSADEKLRIAALYLLKGHWGLDSDLSQRLEAIAFEGDSETASGIAMLYLVHLRKSTGDNRRIGRLLANYVRNETVPMRLRISAYYALFELQRLPIKHWPHVWSPSFRFPEDVNWSFVDSFTC